MAHLMVFVFKFLKNLQMTLFFVSGYLWYYSSLFPCHDILYFCMVWKLWLPAQWKSY